MSAFLAGLVAAGVGLVESHVHTTVRALIVASGLGPAAQRVRAESRGRLESRCPIG
ncbi:hypothetical protein ABEU20_002351 [Rhodococcus sp. PAM 2766]|uniref:Uncharacterized protein n=1 Tax=Rhodococcus parequi TaxID=3137122 RepID=A0ABW9FEM7_9NOCA